MEEAEALWRRGSPNGWLSHSKAASWSLGMWWRRSLPRYIGLELLIYIVLYYTLKLVYRLLWGDGGGSSEPCLGLTPWPCS